MVVTKLLNTTALKIPAANFHSIPNRKAYFNISSGFSSLKSSLFVGETFQSVKTLKESNKTKVHLRYSSKVTMSAIAKATNPLTTPSPFPLFDKIEAKDVVPGIQDLTRELVRFEIHPSKKINFPTDASFVFVFSMLNWLL